MTTMLSIAFASAVLLLFDGLTNDRRSAPAGPLAKVVGDLPVARVVLGALFAAGVAVAASVEFIWLVAAIVAGAWVPLAIRRSAEARRNRLARAAWPDAMSYLIASVRAGISLPEALAALADVPSPLAHGFGAFRSTHRATGSFGSSLDRMRIALDDPVADRVAAALTIAHEVGGGDLVRVLEALVSQLRREGHIRAEVEARWSWTVSAARLAAAAPWLVLALMLTQPEGAHAFSSAGGKTVLLTGSLATLVGYRWMLRIARLPEEARL